MNKALNKKIGLVGGDLRYVKLANLLAENGYEVFSFGLEKVKLNKDIKKCKDIKEVADSVKILFGPMPFSSDNVKINSPFAISEKILIEEIIDCLNENNIFIAGKIESDVRQKLNNKNILFIDLLEREELTILNAVATCEGAIKTALEKSEITLHESNCLVLGFGRIGKILCKMLHFGFGANVYAEARKNSDIAWIRSYGYTPVKLDDLGEYLNRQNIIFNTIPSMILTEERLKRLNKDCIIIDLASKPGGVDFRASSILRFRCSIRFRYTSEKYLQRVRQSIYLIHFKI